MQKKSSKMNIEFGNYPMKPWINPKDNEGQSTFTVNQVNRMNFFLPPKGKEDLFIIKFGQTEPKYELTP